MKVKDFDFRIAPNPYKNGKYCNCGNEDCPANEFHFITGSEAQSRLSDESLQDCIIELYTGLKDSKGNKIYEGDILILTNQYSKTNGVVKIHKEGTFYLDDKGYYQGSLANLAEEYNIKVIGNIHENIDLLESGVL